MTGGGSHLNQSLVIEKELDDLFSLDWLRETAKGDSGKLQGRER